MKKFTAFYLLIALVVLMPACQEINAHSEAAVLDGSSGATAKSQTYMKATSNADW